MTAVVQGRSAAEWHTGLLQSIRLNQWLKTYGSPPFGGPTTLSLGGGSTHSAYQVFSLQFITVANQL